MENLKMENMKARIGGGDSHNWTKWRTKPMKYDKKKLESMQARGYRIKTDGYPIDDLANLLIMAAGYVNAPAATIANAISLVKTNPRQFGSDLYDFATIGIWALEHRCYTEGQIIEAILPIYIQDVTGKTMEGAPDFKEQRIVSMFRDQN